MDPIIDLAPSADENPLAVALAERFRRNVASSPRQKQDFKALRGSVLVVAQDTTATLTMRFDHGRLTIHDGTVGIPSITFCGDESVLRGLANMGVHRLIRIPRVFSRTGTERLALWDAIRAMSEDKLTVYGLFSHPRLCLFLLRVLSDEGGGA